MSTWEFNTAQDQEFRNLIADLIAQLQKPFNVPDRATNEGLLNFVAWRQFQSRFFGNLQECFSLNDAAWRKICEVKDTYFHRRVMPNIVLPKPSVEQVTNTDETQNTNTNTNTNQPKVESVSHAGTITREQILRKIRHDYDINEAVVLTRKFHPQVLKINPDGSARYDIPATDVMLSVTEPIRYNALVRQDQAEWMLQQLVNRKMWGAAFAWFTVLATNPDTAGMVWQPNFMAILCSQNSPARDKQYREHFWYVIAYSLHYLTREEIYLAGRANNSHQHLIDLESLKHLPPGDFTAATHPLLTIGVPSELIYNKNMPLYPLVNIKDRGVYPIEIFKIRFNVFTKNIFQNLDMSQLGFSGSVMPACLYMSPLERIFNLDPSNHNVEYWESEETQANLMSYFSEYYPGKELFNDNWIRSLTWNQVEKLEDTLSDIDICVNALNDAEFDRITLRIFEHIKARLGLENPTASQLQLLKVRTAVKYKYYISGSYLRCSIEIFHPTAEATREGCINRFHLGIVRCCYDSGRVWLCPTAITYAYTGCVSTYRWFATSRPAEHTFLKYFSRGCFPVLNPGEWQRIRDYIANTPEWSDLAEWSAELDVNSPVWRPRTNNKGMHKDIQTVVTEICTENETAQSGAILPNDVKYKIVNVVRPEQPLEIDIRYTGGHIKPPKISVMAEAVQRLINSDVYGY